MSRSMNKQIHTSLLMIILGFIVVVAGLVSIGLLSYGGFPFVSLIFGLVVIFAGIVIMVRGCWFHM